MGMLTAITEVRQYQYEKLSPTHVSNSLVRGTATFILAILRGARAGPASLQSFETFLINAQLNTHWSENNKEVVATWQHIN